MRPLRLAWLAVSCVQASWLAADTQHIEIYEYAGHTWPPILEDSIVIWRNGCVAANASRCTDGLRGAAADIGAAHGMLEEGVGDPNEDGSRTIRILLHNHADQDNDYDPDGAIWLHSAVVGDSLTDHPRKRAIFREMGHAFFDKQVGRRTCRYSCTKAIVEHWGVDEGMARILASQVGEDPPPQVENAPPSTAPSPTSTATTAPEAQEPPELVSGSTQEPDAPATLPAARAGSEQPAPCRGCLSGHAALSVVETLLKGLGRKYLEIRAELVADIGWLTPARRYFPPPPGLQDAPRNYKYGPSLPTRVDAQGDETWVVWYQTGWMSEEALESRIHAGMLPASARSWPALKAQRYVLVNARTGEVDEMAVMPLYAGLDDARSESAWREASEHARQWLTEAGTGKAAEEG